MIYLNTFHYEKNSMGDCVMEKNNSNRERQQMIS